MDAEPFWRFLARFRDDRRLAIPLVLVNLGGVAYGLFYYGPQFGLTPAWLWPWVPDSPLSVGFFAVAIALHAARRPSQLADWLAFLANIKVGLWTGFVLLHYDASFHILQDPAGNLNFWLFWLHLAMALQAFVLARSLRMGWWSWAAIGWFGFDIAMDYGVAPIRYAFEPGCVGTKPITVPCEDMLTLLAVTAVLWILALMLAVAFAAMHRRRARASGPRLG